MFVVLALVMTTSFPSMSHAMMPHDSAKVEKAESCEHGDCHKHAKAEQSSKTAQNDKDHDKCCDKGVCKCVGGNCHGMSKIFGNSSNSLAVVSTDSLVFAFDSQLVASALPERLKRPPKA